MWNTNCLVFPKCSVRCPLCSSFFGGVTHFVPGTVRTNTNPQVILYLLPGSRLPDVGVPPCKGQAERKKQGGLSPYTLPCHSAPHQDLGPLWLGSCKKSPGSVTKPGNNDSSRVEKKGAEHKCHRGDQNVVRGEGGGVLWRKAGGGTFPAYTWRTLLRKQSIADRSWSCCGSTSLRGSSKTWWKPGTWKKNKGKSRSSCISKERDSKKCLKNKTASALNASESEMLMQPRQCSCDFECRL